MSFGASQYAATRIETASPVQVVVQLIDGAILAMHRAQGFEASDTAKRAAELHRAHAIVSELLASLDRQQSPELCDQLTALYDFVLARITKAQTSRDVSELKPAVSVLTTLRGAWAELAKSGF